MTVVNVHEAKTHLSRLLDAAVSGEEVIIAKDGEPFVILKPILSKKRVPGAARGKGALTAAFFDPLPEDELKRWE